MVTSVPLQNKCFLGFDVSKAWLDVADTSGRHVRVANEESQIAALFTGDWAPTRCASLVCEATGGYERGLVRVARRLGLPLKREHPSRTHAYGKVFGVAAKTDRLDARLLAAYALAKADVPALPLASESQQKLAQLAHRLLQLKDMRAAEVCREQQCDDRFIRATIVCMKEAIAAQIKDVQSRITATIDADPELKVRYELLTSCKGVGPQLAQAILALMPEAGAISNRQAAALVGVAPITRSSGSSINGATIRGGRKAIRDILYMAAVSAAMHNPALREVYTRLRAKGKPAKVALVAVMRKLIVMLNTMLRHNEPWTANFAQTKNKSLT